MQNHPAQPPAPPPGTPVAEGRRRLVAAGYVQQFALNTTQNRGEMWQRGNETTQFISYIGTNADLFSTDRLEKALDIPPAN
jgi:hypothetical protein